MTDMTGYDRINEMDIFYGYVSKLISKSSRFILTYPIYPFVSFHILSYPPAATPR